MKALETRIESETTPEELWAVLMDFGSYPAWNPMVVAIEGKPEVGSRLTVTIAVGKGRRMTFRPTVLECDGRRFAWQGKVLVPGIFDGLHWFEVRGGEHGATLLHGEEFRGLLPPLLGGVMRDTHRGLVAMNEALVSEASRRAAIAVA